MSNPLLDAECAINTGVSITSTSTPSINGIYVCSSDMQVHINAMVSYILLNNKFPAGASVLLWPDINGDMKAFPTVALFTAFATAVCDYVFACLIYSTSNGTVGSIPSNQIVLP